MRILLLALLLLSLVLAPAFLFAGPGDEKKAKSKKTSSGAAAKKPSKSAERGGKTPHSKKLAAKDLAAKKLNAKKTAPREPISKEDEREVFSFVRTHHSELRALLVHLKSARPKQFDKAMRDLHRTRERLEQLQRRDMEAYVLELHRWKYKSRAQLLAARLQMTHSDEQMDQLRELLNQRFDVELAILQRNRRRATERVEKLDAQIEKTERGRAESIERQVRVLTAKRGAGKRSTSGKRSKKKTVTPRTLPATER